MNEVAVADLVCSSHFFLRQRRRALVDETHQRLFVFSPNETITKGKANENRHKRNETKALC